MTVESVKDKALQAKLLPTPFFSSFVGRARPGERLTGDGKTRAGAWTGWAIESVTQMSGFSDREYPALVLDGQFHDPKGRGPSVKPHLEIPARVLSRADEDFPDRLALMGNALAFKWWMFDEVKALRRSLFNNPATSISDVSRTLWLHREALIKALDQMARVATPQWDVVEGLLVTRDDGLSSVVTAGFSSEEVAEFFPSGADLHLRVDFDAALAESSKRWAARRLGVWHVSGVNSDGEAFSFGVVTPRLTASSLFGDRMFAAETESPAALLVRGLVLERLVREYLDDEVAFSVKQVKALPEAGGPHLRTIVAQVGKKLPEASLAAAVNFLHVYDDAEAAWKAIEIVARRSGAVLTVTHDGYVSAHANALRYLRRAEEPERDDINIVLPLGWDDKARVVRFSFSLPEAEDK